jgi:hypothetical protein
LYYLITNCLILKFLYFVNSAIKLIYSLKLITHGYVRFIAYDIGYDLRTKNKIAEQEDLSVKEEMQQRRDQPIEVTTQVTRIKKRKI